jgi:hypothetical protein
VIFIDTSAFSDTDVHHARAVIGRKPAPVIATRPPA